MSKTYPADKNGSLAGTIATGISDVVKGTIIGGITGLVGGAFVGVIIDGFSMLTTNGELFTMMFSLIGSAGTGAAIGGSALASVGAAAGGMISIAKGLGLVQLTEQDTNKSGNERLVFSQNISLTHSKELSARSVRGYRDRSEGEPIINIQEQQTIN